MDRQHVTLSFDEFISLESGWLIVERALARTPGVLWVYVNAAIETAYVQYDADRCTIAMLREAVARAGRNRGAP